MAPGRSTAGRALRVAVVHSFYSSRQPSGENQVVEQQVSALMQAGFEVKLVAQSTDARAGRRGYPLTAAATVATGIGPTPLAALREFQPDVVHVHNLFPNFGRNWVKRWEGALVATMHNFRTCCPAGTFYRDGNVCTDCLNRDSSAPAVQHGCYRGSRLQTLPLAASTKFGADPLLARADRVIVLNSVMSELFARAGVHPDRQVEVPNFLPDALAHGAGGRGWLFAGRLTPEKGILELLQSWPAGRQLNVVGDGPLLELVRRCAPEGVSVLGGMPRNALRRLMSQSIGLVFPSRWFEGFPLVYLEALAAGTPVLAWEPSAVAAMVRQHGTGLVVQRLLPDLEQAEKDFPELRDHVRAVFQDNYTEAAWLEAMTSVYREAIASSRV